MLKPVLLAIAVFVLMVLAIVASPAFAEPASPNDIRHGRGHRDLSCLRQPAGQRRHRARRPCRRRHRPPDRQRSRKHRRDDRWRHRRRGRRQRNREEAGAGFTLPDHRAARFRHYVDRRGYAGRQPARRRPRPRREQSRLSAFSLSAMADNMESKTIAIIGGGFAGTTLARELDGKLPPGYELLLINEESHTTFTPMLPEVVGAGVFPEQIVAPIRQMVRRARFVMGRVTSIDFAARTIACDTLAGARVFSYDHVVLAFGNRARLDMIPGAAEHARSPQDDRRRVASAQPRSAAACAHRARDRSTAARSGSVTSS